MRLLLAFAIAVTVSGAEPVEEIVRRSCEREVRNLHLRQQYTFKEAVDQRRLDKNRAVKETETRVREVLWIDGSRYSRLIEKDGAPLSPKDAAKEQAKMDREIDKRKRESPEERRKRLAEREKEFQEERSFRLQVADAFVFKLLGEEAVNGRQCYRVQAEPKAGFVPKGKSAGFLPKMRGVLWIDKADYEWAKVEAETLDTLSFGLALVRIAKGARIFIDQTLVNEEVWFPKTFRIELTARALLLMGGNFEVTVQFSDFRKFAVESTIEPVREP